MGKPRIILLIRHAQSEGNKNRDIHQMIPDHRVKLTQDGWEQVSHSFLATKISKQAQANVRQGKRCWTETSIHVTTRRYSSDLHIPLSKNTRDYRRHTELLDGFIGRERSVAILTGSHQSVRRAKIERAGLWKLPTMQHGNGKNVAGARRLRTLFLPHTERRECSGCLRPYQWLQRESMAKFQRGGLSECLRSGHTRTHD